MGFRSVWLLAAVLLASPAARPAVLAPSGDPDPVPGATWDREGYEDRVLGIRVLRPPAPWVPRPWDGDWSGHLQPVVAFTDPTGAVLSVHARDAMGGDARTCAAGIASTLHITPPPESPEEVEVGGLRGVAFAATGDSRDDSRPYHAHVSVVLRDGLCYALAAFADGKDRLPVLAKTLRERFRILDEGWARRSRPPLDVEGPGWRTREWTVEHAFVGIRVPLGTGWRLAQDPSVPLGVAIPALNLDQPSLSVGIRIRAVALEGRPREEVEEAAEKSFDTRYKPIEKKTHYPFPAAGTSMQVKWRTVRGGASKSRYYALCGLLRGDDRVLMVEILHPRQPDPRVPVAVKDALEGLRVLSAEERTALAASLASQADSQAFVGTGEYVRKGTYVSLEHRILWRKPTPLWSFLPHEAMTDPEEVLVVLQNEEAGLNARLMAFPPVEGDTKWTLHDRIVRGLKLLLPVRRASKAVPASIGSRDSIRTDMKIDFEGIPLHVSLLTTHPGSRGAYALIAVSRAEPAAIAEMEAAVKGLRFQVDAIPGPRKGPKGWEDPGHGFRIEAPGAATRVESHRPLFVPSGGTVIEVEAGGERLVVAAREWPFGEPELEAAATARVLSLLDPKGSDSGRFAGGVEAAGTLGGLPSRDIVHGGEPAIRVARLRAGGILYVVGAAAAPGGTEPGALAWFRLAD